MAEGAPTNTKSWTAGEVIEGKYVLLRPIAKGGMGSVWVAQNKLTERRVAIKFMLPELASSPDTIQRFFREAKASARIDHPSIVDVLDLGTLPDGPPFLVMEYLEGRSLEKIIDTSPLAPVQAAAVMLDVVRALSSAHNAGIVHRDLKPANIFVAKKGDLLTPKILDFGISKITSSMGDIRMTRTGAVLGSPAYMSPEQARGRSDIDGRADIWAVGVILYEAVSGKLPFIGENYNQVMMAITLDPPVPLSVAAPVADQDFIAIVEACLQKERDARPASMEKLSAMIDGYVAPRAAYGIPPLDVGDSSSVRTPATGGTYRLASQVQRVSQRHVFGNTTTVKSEPPPPPVAPEKMTVGAVTILDPPRRRSRGPLVAGLALVGAVSIGITGYFYVAQRVKEPATTASAPATSSTPITTTTTTVSITAIATESAEPTEHAPDIDTHTVIGTGAPTASITAAPTTSATIEPTTKPTASSAPTLKTKPPKLVPKPKPNASATKTGDPDGPAPVGTGPGF